MTATVELLRQAEAAGAEIVIEGEQLKLIRGKLLPSPLVDELRSNKSEILEMLKRDQMAKGALFMLLHTGEAYARQTADNTLVFVIRSSLGKWDAWRETWSRGENRSDSKAAKSVSSKDIASGVNFELALVKSTQYIDRLTTYRRSEQKNDNR